MTTQNGARADRPPGKGVLSAWVKDRILTGILQGNLAPGSRLVETRLARQLGTSQAPVREALRDLATLGFVESEPYRGSWVRTPTKEELIGAIQVRAELEGLAARLAAARRTDECVQDLEELLSEMGAAADRGDPHDHALKNTAFHGRIVQAAENRTLSRLWSMLEPFGRTYVTASAPGIDLHWLSDRHQGILDAIKKEDPEEAEARARAHAEEVAKMLEEFEHPELNDHTSRRNSAPRRRSEASEPSGERRPRSARLSEEMTVGPARIRIDVEGAEVPEHTLENMDFLNYRLAEVRLQPEVTLEEPDLIWDRDDHTTVTWDGRTMRFAGDWAAGPLQKAIVTLLALRMESLGLHPFHSSAVRYRDKTVLFLGGESNHGKSMCQIEACRRGGQLISTETTVIDEHGTAVMGSRTLFIRSRAAGTERADKAAPDRGVEKFFGEMPACKDHEGPSNVDLVVVPAIDGNFDVSTVEMIPFERQFQTLHALQNYFLLNELLAPGMPMPLVDTEELRNKRAAFVERFCERPYFFVRAATPQAVLDETDRVL